MPAETRRANLKKLLADRFGGKIAEMARAIDRDDAYLWQLINGDRNAGERVARHIEGKLGLPPRGLDATDMLAADGLAMDEADLLRDYRKASDAWKLTLRLMAKAEPTEQPQLSHDVNKLIGHIFSQHVPDSRVRESLESSRHGFPPGVHQDKAPYKKN